MFFRKIGIYLLSIALCMSFMPGAVFATETPPEEAGSPPAQIQTEPAEESPEPAEESSEATEEPTESTEGPAEQPEEPTDSTEKPAEQPEEPTDSTKRPAEQPEKPTDSTGEVTEPAEPIMEDPKGWGLYFGQLHSHSDISDGTSSVEALYTQAAAAGLDFFAVTDRGESLEGAETASLSQDMRDFSPDWAAGKAAAEAATNRDFVGLYGFEMAWPREKHLGHIITMNTPGFASWQQPAFSEGGTGLENYTLALAGVPDSVSQFCHPGTDLGDFYGFSRYSAVLDQSIQLLEVGTGADGYRYYNQALDYGWHVAPTCNQANRYGNWADFNLGRTVILAGSLTESGIYEAIRNFRVYATKDADLHIYFDQMGSRLARRNVGPELKLQVRLSDPTDRIGQVEVVVTGGEVIASESAAENTAALTFTVPSNHPWYYLKITQPDGDTAVTAPIWLEGEAEVGIRDFSCETSLPLQGKPIELKLTLHNGDQAQLLVEKIDFSVDGKIIHTTHEITEVSPGKEAILSFSPTLFHLGATRITATVTASLDGQPRSYEKILTVSFRRDDMVTDILVDAAHENMGLDKLKNLELLAAESRIGMVFAEEEVSKEQLSQAGILLITGPKAPFSEEFLQNVGEFLRYGGTVLLCGTAGEDPFLVNQLAVLLDAVASSVAFVPGTAVDEVHNGGQPDQLFPVDINRTVSWCQQVSQDQYYRHISGCAVAGGTWLIKGHSTTAAADGTAAPVLLAWEKIGQGNLFAGGSLWLGDEELAPGKNLWDEPYANQTILEAILGIAAPEIPVKEIRSVREGAEGSVCRIRGYVTAGTSREGNRFPDTVYLQDDTGGIAVTPFSKEGVEVGTPVEITGYLKSDGRNKAFHPVTVQVLDSSYYRFTGITGAYAQVMDSSRHGGMLMQAEGIVQRVELSEAGSLHQIVLWDKGTGYATVLVEPYIVSGSTGKNELALDIQQGQEVRALGLLHLADDGTAVVRVRNCDEVVLIDPWPYTPDKPRQARDNSNPNTGDGIGWWMMTMGVSAAALFRKKD